MNRDAVQNERGPRTSTIRKHLASMQAKTGHSFPGLMQQGGIAGQSPHGSLGLNLGFGNVGLPFSFPGQARTRLPPTQTGSDAAIDTVDFENSYFTLDESS